MQHKQFRPGWHRHTGLRHRRGHNGCGSLPTLLGGPADELHVEALRLAQQVAVGAQGVVLDVDEPIAMHQCRDRHGCLVQCELPPDTGPRPGAERLEQVHRTIALEPVGIEDLDVVAPLRLPVQR